MEKPYKEKNKLIRDAMSELGKRSARKLTKKQRVERAKMAINKRWGNK